MHEFFDQLERVLKEISENLGGFIVSKFVVGSGEQDRKYFQEKCQDFVFFKHLSMKKKICIVIELKSVLFFCEFGCVI